MNVADYFLIELDTGVVYVATTLDAVDGDYHATITVTDQIHNATVSSQDFIFSILYVCCFYKFPVPLHVIFPR